MGNQKPYIDEGHNAKAKRTKLQTTFNKTLQRKLKIKQHEPH